MKKSIKINVNNYKIKSNNAITLISLVITIILLIIISGIIINLSIVENGIFSKAKIAKEETNRKTAAEILNLKITNIQLESYSKTQELPNLQYLADRLCEDNDIEYVELESQVANLKRIVVGENNSIYTKLSKYPYEFEINSSFQLAAIDGKKINMTINNGYPANIKNIVETDNQIVLSYTGDEQEYIAPENGYYKIECWGASGGNAGSAVGGKGAYTNGIIYLTKNEKIYAYIGEAGKNGVVSGSAMDGTYNGGGPCGRTNAYATLSTGGGATDIRLSNGEWDDFNSLKSRIMVAAGGGGACRMNTTNTWKNANGGYGGTIIGGASNCIVANRSFLY